MELGDSLKTGSKISASLKKMMGSLELILAYTWKGMTYYTSLKKIAELEPVHGI
jgi:hypothetical protein